MEMNGSSAKTLDLLKEDLVLLQVFSVLPKVILEVLKDHQEMTDLCGFLLAHTVYLFVKQLNKTITMFLMSKTYLWLHNIEKDFYRLVQIL